MSFMLKLLPVFLLFCIAPDALAAQDNPCPALVQSAVEQVRKVCAALENNQICYGNPSLNIQPRSDVRLVFAQPGDTIPLSVVKSLNSSPFDPLTGNWGFAFMRVRANLPDAGLTMLSFGDVTLDNMSEASADFIALDVTIREPTGANVRENPAPDSPVTRTLFAG